MSQHLPSKICPKTFTIFLSPFSFHVTSHLSITAAEKSLLYTLRNEHTSMTNFISFIHSLVFSLWRPGWQEPEPSHVTGTALAHRILGKFLGVVCHCFPPPLDVPTFATRCLYVRNDTRDPSTERWNCGREICPVILPKFRLPRKFRELLHAANLRHGTDGFTSPPKEDVLRIFSP